MAGPVTAAIACLAVAAVLGGCGLGPGPGTGGAGVIVTQGFGSRGVGSMSVPRVRGSETVMRLLQRSFQVSTRYGGGFVESINGRSGTSAQKDWFYYVNGIQAAQGAAATAVHRGDHVWFDLHDWRAAPSVPAVVGSFPEPFVHGLGGKRFPTALECGQDVMSACRQVTAALSASRVPVASQLIGTGSGSDTLAVVVGTWRELRSAVAAGLIDHGPSASGVYARFSGPAGARLELLDTTGRRVRTLGSGAGLIAATADSTSVPTWLITGTDRAGVSAAAAALTSAALHDHFALAVQGRTRLALPLPAVR